MGRAYSDDLRRKLLEAHSRGDGSLRELAELFGVSHPYALKISAQHKRSGEMERKAQRRYGRQSRVTVEIQQHLRRLLKGQNDLTLAQLQQHVWETKHQHFSLQHLWRVLKKMGLRLKKSHSTPRNRTANRTKAAVRRGAKR